MSLVEKYKSKKQKWLEYSLILAIIIIIMGSLIFFSINKETTKIDSTGENTEISNNEEARSDTPFTKIARLLFIPLIIIILCFILFGRNNTSNLKPEPDDVIIEMVADEIYKEKSIYLDTTISNVRTQRGAPSETYVEFLKEHITYLHLQNIGVVERYPGESIKVIKKAKAEDVVEMTLAKQGISRKGRREGFEDYDLTGELQ